jgi:aspartate racemase
MKTIGLIGGMSWESSLEYYRLLNQIVKSRLGGYHSARCLMLSLDFDEIEQLQRPGRWHEAAAMLVQAAGQLENGGADFIVLCTNTMHKVADEIQASIHIPFLHIAEATAQAIKAQGISRVGLLGTRFTMEEPFYKDYLVEKHALEVIIPDEPDRQLVHQIIFDELVLGVIKPESKAAYLAVIQRLVDAGAQGIILGCTEIGSLVQDGDSTVPLLDTTRIHATAAVDLALV